MAAFLSSVSSARKVSIILLNACSAFIFICALPARSPEDRSVLGSSCLLKLPSLIVYVDKYVYSSVYNSLQIYKK